MLAIKYPDRILPPLAQTKDQLQKATFHWKAERLPDFPGLMSLVTKCQMTTARGLSTNGGDN